MTGLRRLIAIVLAAIILAILGGGLFATMLGLQALVQSQISH